MCSSDLQFLIAFHCPETVAQVVVFHAAVFLYLSVTAMVVGQQEPFRGYKFSRASSSEQHDSIFEGRFIYIIYVFGIQMESFFLHVRDSLAYE